MNRADNNAITTMDPSSYLQRRYGRTAEDIRQLQRGLGPKVWPKTALETQQLIDQLYAIQT